MLRPANADVVLATVAPVVSVGSLVQPPKAGLTLSTVAPGVAVVGGADIVNTFGIAAVFDPETEIEGIFEPVPAAIAASL